MFRSCLNSICKFCKNKIARYVLLFLCYCILLPVFVNNKPIVCKNQSGWSFPFLSHGLAQDYENKKYDFVISPTCNYLPSDLDLDNTNYAAPLHDYAKNKKNNKVHWLGTDNVGRDVLSMYCYGIKNSILIAVSTVIISGFFGVFFGVILGWFNQKIKSSLLNKFFVYFGFLYIGYVLFYNIMYTPLLNNLSSIFLFITWLVLFFLGHKFMIPHLEKKLKLKQNYTIDFFGKLFFIISSFNIIPNLLIYVFVLSIIKPSMFNLIALLSITNFSDMALIIRSETLRIKNNLYVEAGIALGYSNIRIMVKHLLPNLWPFIITLCALSLSSVILTEAGLSFLGLGLDQNTQTIGTLLLSSKNNFEAWWITIPCILFIFIIALLFKDNTYRQINTLK